ncbi:phosphoadenosine phosphosulfate reductase family protein [Methanoplanus sp. FWC-SCC4]|uniref:Phosphoadenosine phosphosulfate reductase family protein n=1 Tax=Methanochimaera problematica TaxID=2609417 RepID=A0AA97FBH5_9EURY|nr:phosphoadenosine phosphosulfate reductase family protein [Methanoplanus sp. FWC-SCC4]WOF15909.1 phosphoadenosine phosphosulfate reductase family protein [Methanoplanus sp. FWC-SCC4]
MSKAFLGKLVLNWCDECHTPVLGKKCSCGAQTREVPITPPGDIRPAFKADIDHINKLYEEHFGTILIPEGHVAVLNKIPDKDRMEEVIMGGSVVCAYRYLPEEKKWEILPRIHAAKYSKPLKRYVVADDGAIESIMNGSSLLAPGLVEIQSDVRAGDEVFILDREGNCIGVGRAREDAADAEKMERGSIVRTRKPKKGICIKGESTWDNAVLSNNNILENVENEAVRFVRSVVDKNPDLPRNVSYSGGKDSLATLLVVLKAIGKTPILFSDTELEFPETYKNVEDVVREYDLEIIHTGAGQEFWDNLEIQGPPAVDVRWCCSVCKLMPVKRIIEEKWGECLSFIGQRKYESLARMKSPRVWRNYKVQVQLSAAPIQHWTALHVFLYLFREKAPYNILYEQRIDRIGCFMCPSSDLATFEIIKEQYPKLWEMWEEKLHTWMDKNNLPEDWWTNAEWRKRGGEDDTSSYT